MSSERLQKVLAHRGVASRRASEELITAGRVRVNGQVVSELGAKVDPETDVIEVDGHGVEEAQEPIVIMLHKPKGFDSTVSDPHAEKTVMDLVRIPGRRLYPVGRLDRESRGLILLTDDGELAQRLLHPQYGAEKIYEVRARGNLDQKSFEIMGKGVELAEGRTAPARVEEVRMEEGKIAFRIAIKEGKKRQIRMMVRALGGRVYDLRRVEFAGLKLATLQEGYWRQLTRAEVSDLRKKFGLRPPARKKKASKDG